VFSVIAAKEFGGDYPSRLPPRFGTLIRSLSLSPGSGILEDVGARLHFEEPYWSGRHPVSDDEDEQKAYPLPFHPLELGEAAIEELFGYQLEGLIDRTVLEPETIPLVRYKRSRSRWKFWR
jgi:hypothetical protein